MRIRSGTVDPGDVVRFNFDITDPASKLEFFLLQEPRPLLAGLPESCDVSGLVAAVGSNTGGDSINLCETDFRHGSPSDLPSLAQNVGSWGTSGPQFRAAGLPILAQNGPLTWVRLSILRACHFVVTRR